MTNLIFVIGFLGSGKTTFINNIVKREKNIGLIVNDFGRVNIDQFLIQSKSIPIIDIHHGSVFCDCKSEALFDALKELSHHQLKTIYVESTGLANPKSLDKLLDLINQDVENPIEHLGNIGIIDASTIHKIISTNLIHNQIQLSNILLLNKCDLVQDSQIQKIKKSILDINSTPLIIESYFANWFIDTALMKQNKTSQLLQTESPGRLAIDISKLTLKDIEHFSKSIAGYCQRIKGYLTGNETHYFEYIDDTLKTSKYPKQTDSVMILLTTNHTDFTTHIKDKYYKLFNEKLPLYKTK